LVGGQAFCSEEPLFFLRESQLDFDVLLICLIGKVQKKRCSCFHKWLHPRLVSNMIRFIKLIGLFSVLRSGRIDCGSCSALAIEVEGFVNFFLRGILVDADVADITK